jgi:hypothetical protein
VFSGIAMGLNALVTSLLVPLAVTLDPLTQRVACLRKNNLWLLF